MKSFVGFDTQSSSTVLRWTPPRKPVVVVIIFAVILPILIPVIHMIIFSNLWKQYNRVVDKRTCSCSCWDTVFKGNYEAGISGYKHMYFNATPQSAKIWLLTVMFVIGCYESMKHVLSLLFRKELRFSMFILFGSVVYSHYYSFWGYVNYYNDDFYSQFYHQLFFTATELVSTVVVLYLADANIEPTSGLLLAIVDVAVIHILTSGWDQFVTNVIKQEGQLHQVLRDVFFMIPDLLHLFFPLLELQKLAKLKKRPATHLISNKQFFCSVLVILFGWLFCLML